jgi:acyl carrier protein
MLEQEIRDAVFTFILDHYPAARGGGLAIDGELLDSGIVDSMGILELVMFLEERFGIALDDDEMLPDNFRSVPAIAALVSRKLGTASS